VVTHQEGVFLAGVVRGQRTSRILLHRPVGSFSCLRPVVEGTKNSISALGVHGNENRVYICHCGINIAATVDIQRVTAFAQALPHVVIARNYQYMCSDPGRI